MGVDLPSEDFLKLNDLRLADLGVALFEEQASSLGMAPARREALDESLLRAVPAVLRQDAPHFDLDDMLRRFADLCLGGRPKPASDGRLKTGQRS